MIEPEDAPEISFADSTAVDALEEHVNELLRVLARHLDRSGVANAWVSDESTINDFLTYPWTGSAPQEQIELRALEAAGEDLGIDIKPNDYVYELAIKMRDS